MRQPKFGGIKMTTMGPSDRQDARLADFDDGDLTEELAARGYDVTVRVPKASVMVRRRAEHAAKQRAKPPKGEAPR